MTKGRAEESLLPPVWRRRRRQPAHLAILVITSDMSVIDMTVAKSPPGNAPPFLFGSDVSKTVAIDISKAMAGQVLVEKTLLLTRRQCRPCQEIMDQIDQPWLAALQFCFRGLQVR
ncbi:MAG: hypothetical protein OXD42_00885 [Rhodospirillaceae bacterium]|nr:hypothetical protein [Rhodospirillaceae bacterium]MCY4237690.1 hypothetical protein [Rhodospirillaceae bacterium]